MSAIELEFARLHRTALENHCRLAAETMNPKLRRIVRRSLLSVIVSVNSGYE